MIDHRDVNLWRADVLNDVESNIGQGDMVRTVPYCVAKEPIMLFALLSVLVV
ncbi:MAG: hypothetical protein LUG61_03175 [Lachnospiraceae bacterium]|nr:hypothetical protein [Lachnospiraceae bacterium]